MKKIETKKRGSYGIVTLAIREPLLSMLNLFCHKEKMSRSQAIRELIKIGLNKKGIKYCLYDSKGKEKDTNI